MKDDKKKVVTIGHESEKASYSHVNIMNKLFKSFSRKDYEEIEPIVLERLNKDSSVLEVGCDKGEFCLKISKKAKAVKGVDIVKNNIMQANKNKKKLGIRNVEFYESDIEDFALEKKSYDMIICIDTLQYFYDPYTVLERFNDSLKKDGILIISVPNVAFLRIRLKLLSGKLPNCSLIHNMKSWDSGILHYYTKKEFAKLLNATEYDVERYTCSGFFNRIRKLWISLLGWDIIVVAKKKS